MYLYPSLRLDTAITFLLLLRALEFSHYPWELKRLSSEFNSDLKWLTFTPSNTKLWFGFIFCPQLPNVKVWWIKHAQLQAFYLTSGFAIKNAIYPHPFSLALHISLPLFFWYCRVFSPIVQRNCDVYFHVIWFWNSVTLCSEFFQNIIFFQ